MTLDKVPVEEKLKESSPKKEATKDVSESKFNPKKGDEKTKEKKVVHKSEDKNLKKDRSRTKQKKRRGSSSSSSSSSSSKSRSGSSSSSKSSSGSSSSSSRSDSKTSASGSRSSSSSSSSSASNRRKPSTKDKGRKTKRSRSRSPRRRKRSPSPRPKKVYVGRLSRNVHKEHLYEIFGLFGPVKNIDLPPDHVHCYPSRGFAYVEFENEEDADFALEHMDGGQIDGQKINVAPVLYSKLRAPPMRRMSPKRRGPFPPWRRSFGDGPWRPRMDRRRRPMSPFRRRSPRHRSRSRSKSRSPVRRRPTRRSSSSSSH